MACQVIHFADDVDVEEIMNVVEDNEDVKNFFAQETIEVSDFRGMVAFLSS